MTSEPTEPQGAEEEGTDSGSGRDDASSTDRVEARAQGAERVESKTEPTGGDSEKSVVPAPSESSSDRAEDSDEPREVSDDGEAAEGDESESESHASEDSSDASVQEDAEPADDEVETTDQRFTDLEHEAEPWLAELFDHMNFDAGGRLEWEDGEPRIDIGGPDAERLLGHGKLGPKAIEGIETLLQSVFSEDDAARDVYVDVGDQRAARKEMLREVAVSLADKAVALDRTLTVSGLNSTERRIIHRKLRDYDGVETESVGDGIFRRLTIDPN